MADPEVLEVLVEPEPITVEVFVEMDPVIVEVPVADEITEIEVVVPGPPGPLGPQGPAGPQGPVGSEESISAAVQEYFEANPFGGQVHQQSSPSDAWVITHSLPWKPAVSIVDSAGTRIETTIIYDSATQIRSLSSAPFSGAAYLS